MARINIEDSLFKDPGFTDLAIKVQSRTLALGMIVEGFMLAQKWYLEIENDRLIPAREWAKFRYREELVEHGFAEVREGGVYVRGSEDQFSWLVQRQEAGRKGGLAKSHKNEMKVAVASGRLAGRSGAKPLTPTLTLSQEDNKNYVPSDEGTSKAGGGWDLEAIYQQYPKRKGQMKKGAGMARLKSLVKSEADYELAMKAVTGYRAFIAADGKFGTEFVKMFSSFWDSRGDWKEFAERKSSSIEVTDDLIQQAMGVRK